MGTKKPSTRFSGRGQLLCLILLVNLLLSALSPMAQTSDDGPSDLPPEPTPSSRQEDGLAPDLKVSNITLAVENPIDGSKVAVFTQVANVGTSVATDFIISIYSSGNEISSVQVASLAAGNSTTASAMVEVHSGYLELKAVADVLGDINEISEANNMFVRTIKVLSPDLRFTDLSFIPANYTDGDKVIITTTILNGGADTISPFSCSVSVDQELLQSKTFSGLRAGDSVVMMGQWTAVSGQHDLVARADTQDALSETNESNNVLIKPLSSKYPDLRIDGLGTQPTLTNVTDGDNVLITAKVRNGGWSTHNSFQVRLMVDGVDKDAVVVSGLEANGTRSVAFQWVALGGKHELRLDVDPHGAVMEANEGDNFVLLGADIPVPDLKIDDLRLTPIMPADGGEVKASAIVRNTGPGATNRTLYVQFLANGEPIGESEIKNGLDVNATAAANLSFEAHSGKTIVAAFIDRGAEVAESDEGNNWASKVLDVMFPDLWLTNLTVSPNATSLVDGQTGAVKVTVRNNGPGNTTTSFFVDVFLDGRMLNRVPVDGLPTGVPKVVESQFIASGGIHYLSARVDTAEGVRESDETNNIIQTSISVGLPDISVEDLIWTPSNPIIGQTARVTAVLKNLGKPTDRDIFVELLANGTSVGYTTVAGSTLVGTVNAAIDYKVVGNEGSMEVRVDKHKDVPEVNETNNNLVRTFPAGNLVARIPGPDLIVTDLSWLPAKPMDGEDTSFIVSFKNKGAVPDPGSDGSKALQPSITILVDNEKVSTNSVKMLSTDGVVVVPWTATAGIHTIRAIVDWEMSISENNETNNMASKDISVGKADITLSGLDLISKGSEDGNIISLFVKVNNIGNRTMRSFQLSYYVDGFNAGTEIVEGVTLNKTTTVLHSWTATPGTHAILVVADTYDQVVETDESRNLLNGTITIRSPDLSIESLKAPSIVDDGSQATMTVRIKNRGNGGTIRQFALTFYLDGMEVGTETINGLPSGGELVISRSVAPGPGKHYIRAVIDPKGLITEGTELNNAISRPGINVTYSDVMIAKLWMDQQDDVSTLVYTTIQNKGNSTTRPVNIKFYLDGDLFATDRLEGLAGRHNTTLAKPMALGPGSHRIRVILDPDGQLSETDESNNQAVLTTPFRSYPNLYIDEFDVVGPLVQGGQLHVTANVKSLGGDVRTPFLLTMYVDGALSSSTRIKGIPKGEVAIVNFGTIGYVGQHHIRLQVDPDGAVQETNETDNGQVSTFTVDAPDLQITEVQSYTHPNGLAVFARVRNNASHLLTPFMVSIYGDGKMVGKVQIKGLPSMTSTQMMAIVPSTTELVLVIADEDGQVAETDESNNQRTARLRPNPVEGDLDLGVADIIWVPQFPIEGDIATFFVLVDNIGNRTLMEDATVDVRIDDVTVAQGAVTGLPEGGTAVLTFQWAVSAGKALNLTVRLDPEHAIQDTDLSNNNMTSWLNVSMPDLKVLSVTYPNGSFGEPGTMFMKIGNIGEGDTYRHFSASVMLEGTPIAIETLTGLPAGANTTIATVIDNSWGGKELLAEVDPERSVRESNEGNTRLSNLTIGYPDLSVVSLWTETGANASMTTAFAEVRNSGIGIGQSFTVNAFLDGNGLGPRPLNGLQHNGTAVLSWTFGTVEGASLSALADEGNEVPESNELNNYYERNITGNSTYVPPDVNLALTSLNITQFGRPDELYRLDALVENQGPNITSFKMLFLVDGRILQENSVEPMKNNTTRTVTLFWNGSIATHIFKVIVDSGRAIPELDETDNEVRIIYAANIPPTPLPGNDQTITQGDKATLYARGSDADGRIVRYEWDFNGDGKYEWSSNESRTIKHTYSSLPPKGAKYYNATLRVTDDRGATSTAVVRVKVVEKRPWFKPPEADTRRVVSFALGMTCIIAGVIIFYMFIRASKPLKVTKAEKERQAKLEKEGYRRPWPPWRKEPKDEDEDERESEPEVEGPEPVLEGATKAQGYPEYPEDDASEGKSGQVEDEETPVATISEPSLPEPTPPVDQQYPEESPPAPSDEEGS